MSAEHFAVIGDPIDHSLSPAMYNAALAAAGIDACYEAIHVPSSALEHRARELLRDLRGFNVTVPHKVAIMPFLTDLDSLARSTGAVNTVVIRDSMGTGFNTDVQGFRRALEAADVEVSQRRIVVLGAGGASRAVVVAFADTAARITVVSRSEDRAVKVAALVEGRGLARGDAAATTEIALADIVVNATSLGLGNHAHENPLDGLPPPKDGACLIDLVYGQLTPFQRTGLELGLCVLDGLEMLVQQGAASFRLFTGQEPDVRVMREACLAALDSRRLAGVRP